ncbi:type II secretion system F family protein [Candidatus Parcubacteria bacterium]|nr:type II secretion system F family protein [Candidatus Parcubacteria bacterium]
MLYSYKISNTSGKTLKGTIEASSINGARNKLASKEGIIVSLEPVAGSEDKYKSKGKKKKGGLVFGKLKLLEKVMFAKHLSVMIQAGLSIDKALKVLADSGSPLMSKKLNQILVDVRKGHTLSDSLAKHKKDFDRLFVNMVAVGEKGGNLAKNLQLLSIQQRKSYELKSKIKSASVYPTLVIVAVVGLMIVISAVVLPKIVNFFTTLSVELPMTTKVFIVVASFMGDNWRWVLLGIIGLVILFRALLAIRQSRLVLHTVFLKLPITGKIVRNMNLALFCRTLGSLLDSGITIDKSLHIVSETVTSDVYRREIDIIYHKVLKGTALSDCLSKEYYFPSIVRSMTQVGENSGKLGESLSYLSDFYESEVDHSTKNLSTALEPALLIFIGLIVGFVAMAIINPIYGLTSGVGR